MCGGTDRQEFRKTLDDTEDHGQEIITQCSLRSRPATVLQKLCCQGVTKIDSEAGVRSRHSVSGRVGSASKPEPRLPITGYCNPNRSAARAFALAASSSRFLGGAVVSSEASSRAEIWATSSTAARNAASFAFEGFVKPL